jgi:hypothetical protein
MPVPGAAGPTFQLQTFTENDGAGSLRRRSLEELADRIMEIEILDADRGKDELVVTLDNKDLELLKNTEVWFGRVWRIAVGYPGRLSAFRGFRVHQLRGYREMELRAYGGEQELDTIERSEEWTIARVREILGAEAPAFIGTDRKGVRRSDVAIAIARRNHLTVFGAVRQTVATGQTVLLTGVQETIGEFEKIMQTNETDAALLQRMADDVGFVWYVDPPLRPEGGENVFQFHERNFQQDLSYEFDLHEEILVAEPVVDFNIYNVPNQSFSEVYAGLEGTVQKKSLLREEAEDLWLGSSLPIVELERRLPSTAQKPEQQAEEQDGPFKRFQESLLKIRLRIVGDPLVYPKRLCRLKNFMPFLDGVVFYIESIRYFLRPGESFAMELNLLGNALSLGGKSPATARDFAKELYRLEAATEVFVKGAIREARRREEANRVRSGDADRFVKGMISPPIKGVGFFEGQSGN